MKVSIKIIGFITVLIANALSADELQNQMAALKSEMEQVKQVLEQKLAVAEKDYAEWSKKSKEDFEQRFKAGQAKGIGYLPSTDKEYADYKAFQKVTGFRNGLRVVNDTLNKLIDRIAIPHQNLTKVNWETGFVNPFAAAIRKLQHGKEFQEEAASRDRVYDGANYKGVVEALELGLGYLQPLLAKAQSIVQ